MFFFKKKRKKVGLALSGGAARGITHLGVIKALKEHHVPIDMIAGTSSGSLVGGLYSAGLDIDKMIDHVKILRWLDLAGFHLSRKGVVSSRKLERFVRKLVGKIQLKDLSIPFKAIATDILTGQSVELGDKDLLLSTAIRASSSFPGIYPPVKIKGNYYIDGGASSNLPVNAVKSMGADFIIGVDAIPTAPLSKLPKNIPLMVDRGLDLILSRTCKEECKAASVVLSPITEYIHSFDIKKADEIIQLGRDVVTQNLSKLKEVIYED